MSGLLVVLKNVKIGLQVIVKDSEVEQAVDGLEEEEEEGRKVCATAVTGGAPFILCQVGR